MNYFNKEINGWESWAQVFCQTETFRELSKAIFEKEGIAVREDIKKLTPGTNAVFKADGFVIKIYAPEEAGFKTEADFNTELTVMRQIRKKGVAAPEIITYGEIKDKYLFRYIIMEYIDGKDAGDILPYYSLEQRKEIVKQLKEILKCLNQPADNLIGKKDLKKQALHNPNLTGLPQTLINDLADCVNEQNINSFCLVHGDITEENVLVNSKGEIRLIDFADCTLAPEYYELAPIIFELFRGDKDYVREFIGEEDKEEFLDKLIKGLALHNYCGNIIKDYLTRLQIPYDKVKDMEELKQIIKANIFYIK